ncbi:MAG: hypothetical protein ACLT98_13025 [Eggerthellaceae bacterium]
MAAAHADGEGAAVADSTFARLQDGWAYENYMPADTLQAAASTPGRNDAQPVLRQTCSHVGLASRGRCPRLRLNGVYHHLSEANWSGAGLTDDMTDTQFVSALCDYVGRSGVLQGSRKNTRDGRTVTREKAQCLSIIQRTGDTHDIAGSWYVPCRSAMRLGIVRGFPEGDFRPEAQVTCAQVGMLPCRPRPATRLMRQRHRWF